MSNPNIHITPQDKLQYQSVLQGGTVYFLGIGGIGMSALAKYFVHIGATVMGYDKTKTTLTTQLEQLGITITYNNTEADIVKDVCMVIYTPAIPTALLAWQYYKLHKYTLLKRSQVLGLITACTHNICVAGTHGKTTVSTMVSHLLQYTGYGCNAFLGGISVNYNDNYINTVNSPTTVIEADEYDRSFLQLSPSIGVITSMDADHLDIYGTAEQVHEAFIEFSKCIKPNGILIANYDLVHYKALIASNKYTYHISNTAADCYASNIVIVNGSYQFTAVLYGISIPNVVLHIGGMHNIENMIAAMAVAYSMGIAASSLIQAVAAYQGVKRRFEYIIPPTSGQDAIVMIDDYAHHPTELTALLTGVNALYPLRKMVLIFQPHLYSRTQDFSANFSQALSLAHQVLLLPIYPAREQPIPGVTSELLLPNITSTYKQVLSNIQVLDWVRNNLSITNKDVVLVVAGAGDVDLLLTPIKNIILSHNLNT